MGSSRMFGCSMDTAHTGSIDAHSTLAIRTLLVQRAGLTITRKAHLWHHKAPYDCNYCIVSGHCNPFLDRVGFFPALERLVYSINGVKPRCWTEDSSWVSWAADGTIAKKG